VIHRKGWEVLDSYAEGVGGAESEFAVGIDLARIVYGRNNHCAVTIGSESGFGKKCPGRHSYECGLDCDCRFVDAVGVGTILVLSLTPKLRRFGADQPVYSLLLDLRSCYDFQVANETLQERLELVLLKQGRLRRRASTGKSWCISSLPSN
jgi:hypothetical protein